MKTFFLIPFIALVLFSCQNDNQTTKKIGANQKEPYFKPNFHYVQQTPDSLRTPEQKKLLKKLTLVIYENLDVKNNEMVFKLSEKEFVAKGIPAEYYELVQKDLVNNNKFFKDNNITNVDSMLKGSRKQIKDSLQNYN